MSGRKPCDRYSGPYVYLPVVCGEVVAPVAHVVHAVEALKEAGRPTTVPQLAATLETTEGDVVRMIAKAVRRKATGRR